jgi:hypothetical protein
MQETVHFTLWNSGDKADHDIEVDEATWFSGNHTEKVSSKVTEP